MKSTQNHGGIKMQLNNQIPSNSILRNYSERIHYADSYSVTIQGNETVDSFAEKIFDTPRWIDFLMNLRNAIVKKFGLKTGKKQDYQKKSRYNIGDRISYFKITERSDTEIIFAKNDRHLNFKISIFRKEDKLTMSTIVHFNNFFGHFYFFFIKPFHRVMMRKIMGKLNREK